MKLIKVKSNDDKKVTARDNASALIISFRHTRDAKNSFIEQHANFASIVRGNDYTPDDASWLDRTSALLDPMIKDIKNVLKELQIEEKILRDKAKSLVGR